MEFCEGGKVDDLQYMKNHKISSDEASQNYLISTCANMVDVIITISVLAYFEDLVINHCVMTIKTTEFFLHVISLIKFFISPKLD